MRDTVLKALAIVGISFIAIILAFYCLVKLFFICYSYPKYDREETEIFEEYADDFKLINSYISESFDTETENSISISRDGEKAGQGNIIGLWKHVDISLSAKLKTSFNRIDKAFQGYEFSFIDISKSRISYGGLGYRMYVFSKDGKAPKYFYHPGDGMHFECFKLGNDWYLLTVNFR